MNYEDVRLKSADGSEARAIRSQPGISSPVHFPGWNSPPGSGCVPLRTRFFLCVRYAKRILYGPQICAPPYGYLVLHSRGTEVPHGSNQEHLL